MARRKTPLTEPPADPVEGPVAADEPVPESVSEPEPEFAEPAIEAKADFPPDPVPSTPPLPPTLPRPAEPRRSGMFGPLLGGALAALAGFGLSHFNIFGLAAPDQSEALAALDQRLVEGLAGIGADQDVVAALRADLGALATRIDTLEAVPVPEALDLSDLDEMNRRLSAIEAMPAGGGEASTAALAAKLAELERRIAAQPRGMDQTEVDAALARLATAEAEAARRAEEAAAAVEAAARAQAQEQLRVAVAAGAGFQAELAALDDPALTAALQSHAEGVATLASLQDDFPEAARQALQIARDSAGADGWGDRLVDFLAAQTGARSLAPREGDDPDAILSRSEFALSEGRLTDALAELGTLDELLRAPFSGWIARAEARLAVETALEGR